MSKLYLAYGSNLNIQQMAYRCPSASVLSQAEIPGYRLCFRGNPTSAVATIEPDETMSVPVLLWEIKPRDELALDRYEGYPYLYTKQSFDLSLDGEQISAMAYLMAPGHELGTPSETYLQTILEGYNSAGFDPEILKEAMEFSASSIDNEAPSLNP